MKFGTLILTLVALLVVPTVDAQAPAVNLSQPDLVDDADTAPNLYLGLAGVAGALAAIFISGGLLYSAFGGVGLAEDLAVVKYLREDYQRLRADPEADPRVLATAAKAWNEARDDANWKTGILYVGGGAVYTVAGGLIAAFFAGGLIDAFIIGLGWTGMVSTLASRYNVSIVQERKNDMTQLLLEKVEGLNQQLAKVEEHAKTVSVEVQGGGPRKIEPMSPAQLKQLRNEVQQVKRMGW